MNRIIYVNGKEKHVIYSHEGQSIEETVDLFMVEYGLETVPDEVSMGFISKLKVESPSGTFPLKRFLELES